MNAINDNTNYKDLCIDYVDEIGDLYIENTDLDKQNELLKMELKNIKLSRRLWRALSGILLLVAILGVML